MDTELAPTPNQFLIEFAELIAGHPAGLPLDYKYTGGDDELGPDEKLLCVVPSGPLRLLWLAGRYYQRLKAEAEVKYKYESDPATEATYHTDVHRYAGYVAVYRQAFWLGLQEAFPALYCENLSMRKGWGVTMAADKNEMPKSLSDVLNRIIEVRGIRLGKIDIDQEEG